MDSPGARQESTGRPTSVRPPRFFNEDDVEIPAVTAEVMREIDRLAVEQTGPNLFQMMENAGRSLASHATAMLGPAWHRGPVVVLAGPGGNGGGGICAARHLVNRNATVRLHVASSGSLAEVPAWQRHVFAAAGGLEAGRTELDALEPTLIIDALLGYGLQGPPAPPFDDLIAWANASDAPILSLDLPSGLDATTGEAPGAIIDARSTLTLALPKTGLHPARTGDLWLADLGIAGTVYHRLGLSNRSPFGSRFQIHLRVEEAGPPCPR